MAYLKELGIGLEKRMTTSPRGDAECLTRRILWAPGVQSPISHCSCNWLSGGKKVVFFFLKILRCYNFNLSIHKNLMKITEK